MLRQQLSLLLSGLFLQLFSFGLISIIRLCFPLIRFEQLCIVLCKRRDFRFGRFDVDVIQQVVSYIISVALVWSIQLTQIFDLFEIRIILSITWKVLSPFIVPAMSSVENLVKGLAH